MTKEVAIKGLKAYREEFSGYEPNEEMFDMAIKALEQEPCDDCVSRKEVEELVYRFLRKGTDENIAFYEHFLDLPSVTPQERKGHWIKTPKAVMGEGYMWYCDKCEHQVYQDTSRSYPSENFCPNCGSDNREVEE